MTFTGDTAGNVLALRTSDGATLWHSGIGRVGNSPITYELDGHQYVAILSGLGGDPSFYYSAPKGGMLWVFSVDGAVSESSKYSQDVIPAMLPEYKP